MGCFKVFLGGLNATGKTTLINKLAGVSGIEVCQGSEEFFKWMKIGSGNYQLLESLHDENKDLELSKMMDYLIHKADSELGKEIWLFAGHFGRIHGELVLPAVGSWISNFDLLVLMSADPVNLIERVMHDNSVLSRKRNKLHELITSSLNPVQSLEKLLGQTEKISNHISGRYAIPILRLNSSGSSPDKLVFQFLNFIYSY